MAVRIPFAPARPRLSPLCPAAPSTTAPRGFAPDGAGRIHVLAIGGAHQFAHIVPVACELERRYPGQARIFVPARQDAQAVRALARAIGQPLPELVEMRLPPMAEAVLPAGLRKIARLLVWAERLRQAALILCAERTTTILRRLSAQCPPILHIPHGAGDRAVGFEKRFALFDHVLVAGRKDRDRLVAGGRVNGADCTVTGPVKLSAMLRQAGARAPLFANERPVILYNPHFSTRHRSIDRFGRRLVEAVVRDGRYNLVVAPHVRLAKRWSARRRRAWEAMAVPDRVLIDLGSPRSNDMTYTLGADLYLGDVSSQVYEFLVRPRPCLFVDAHGADWRESEDYAMWHFGEVIGPDADPVAAIDRAFADHGAYRTWQKERMRYAIEGIAWLPDGTPVLKGQPPVAAAADLVARIAGLEGAGGLAIAA
ncbi:glycosyl transferase [Novosphingobium album (ex Liu et al. 2023)]|uniref:Glycosyl transferase n=1 Tax=Novosphingobium album (ex Liu et al. 2023) TaxID=3031130 RepID=A0ABT5WSF6_9SPHN|nr:glycosyl transferase [Novosphingobium album (ex Liu et al. 2023)]MDE8652985.1 glycosyl transferase [Novosphingobium album (ex Liu et al. 2023)]